jgi:hypothetical protein
MFVAIPFSNVSESGDACAVMDGVSGTVCLYDESGVELDRSYGRWREIARPYLNAGAHPRVEGMDAPAGRITLAPDTQEHLFDVLAWEAWGSRASGNRCALVRDPLAQMFGAAHTTPPTARCWLGEGRFSVEVTLRGTNVDGGVTFRYELRVDAVPPGYPDDRATPGPILTPVSA